MKRVIRRFATTTLFAVGLAGCRHKPTVPRISLPPATTVPVVKPPDTAQTVPILPTIPVPLTPIEIPTKRVKKHRRPATAVASAAPPPGLGPVTPDAPPAVAPAGAAVIGAITPGGDDSSARYREAQGLIASLDRRLQTVPATLQQTQQEQLVRIVHFNQEAQKALRGGDAEGAVNLATKGKLLLDDLMK